MIEYCVTFIITETSVILSHCVNGFVVNENSIQLGMILEFSYDMNLSNWLWKHKECSKYFFVKSMTYIQSIFAEYVSFVYYTSAIDPCIYNILLYLLMLFK